MMQFLPTLVQLIFIIGMETTSSAAGFSKECVTFFDEFHADLT
jgi:hypothetical protein